MLRRGRRLSGEQRAPVYPSGDHAASLSTLEVKSIGDQGRSNDGHVAIKWQSRGDSRVSAQAVSRALARLGRFATYRLSKVVVRVL